MISFLFPYQTSPMPVICVPGISPLEVALKFLKRAQPGHRLADCQNAIGHNSKELLLEDVEEIKQEIELPIHDQPLHEEVGGNFKGDEGVALMTRKTPYTKTWNRKRSCLWSAPKWINWRRFWKWRGTYDMEYSLCTWALAALFFFNEVLFLLIKKKKTYDMEDSPCAKAWNRGSWLRTKVFYATCNVSGRMCSMIINGGSCENVVSQELIQKLNLRTEFLSKKKKKKELKSTFTLTSFLGLKGNDLKVA